MAIIKWFSEKIEKQQKEDLPTRETIAVDIAKDVAEEMNGSLLVVFADADGEAYALVGDCDSMTGIVQVTIPIDAVSMDDVPDKAKHFCSGYDAMSYIIESFDVKPQDAMQSIAQVLRQHDDDAQVRLTMDWIKMGFSIPELKLDEDDLKR